MPEVISGNDWLCWDEIDVSGVTNNAPFQWSRDVKDFLCYKAPTLGEADPLGRKRLWGAEDWSMSVSGYVDFLVNYAAANTSLESAADIILTRGYGRALGSKVHLLLGLEGSYSIGGPVGDVMPLTAELKASNSIVVPGLLFEFGSKAATGNGTSQEIGAQSAAQNLYLHAHGVAISGTPTFALIYETSELGDYTDAVTKHTFTDFTAVGRQRAVVAGPETDTHGRFRWTLTGTGTILFRLAAGIR